MTFKDFMEMEKPWKYNFEFECGDKDYKALPAFERYFTYKISPEATAYDSANQFIINHFGYSPICDPDGSGKGYYTLIHEIYNALWRWEKDKNSTFGTLKGKPDICEFGADTMNSVQTALGLTIEPNRWGNRSFYWTLECWGKDGETYENKWKSMAAEEYIEAYHTLGNFVLVPKWFNGDRGTKLYLDRNEETPGYVWSKEDGGYYKKVDDFWDLSLEYLYDNGFHKKINKSTVNFDKEMFDWYINYFFLWDYVEDKGECYKPKHIAIKENGERDFTEFFKTSTELILRRGKFMTAMQMLKQDDYHKLQSGIFDTSTIYSGYDSVISEIEKKISLNDSAKAIMNGLKNKEGFRGI